MVGKGRCLLLKDVVFVDQLRMCDDVESASQPRTVLKHVKRFIYHIIQSIAP